MADIGAALVGLLGVAVGLGGYRYAYEISWFGEQLDAIGSRRSAGKVEPAGWKVMFTKVGSLTFAGVMGLFTFFAALSP